MSGDKEYCNVSGIEELIARMLDLPEVVCEDEVYEKIYDKWELEIEEFDEIVGLLLPFVPPMKSPLSHDFFHTLGYMSGSGNYWVDITKKRAKKR